jgi:hypothetical protein
LVVVLVCAGAGRADAQSFLPDAAPPASPFSRLTFVVPQQESSASAQQQPPQEQQPPPAFEYSDGYRVRAKIHRIASFATLPIFAAEGIVGQSLYDNPTDAKKSAHLVIAGALGTLFAVNSVTGVWNLLEARKDPTHRTRRTIHGVLMLVADAGFLATAMTGPESEHGEASSSDRSRHRAIAFTSIGVATVSYLIMLFGG